MGSIKKSQEERAHAEHAAAAHLAGIVARDSGEPPEAVPTVEDFLAQIIEKDRIKAEEELAEKETIAAELEEVEPEPFEEPVIEAKALSLDEEIAALKAQIEDLAKQGKSVQF